VTGISLHHFTYYILSFSQAGIDATPLSSASDVDRQERAVVVIVAQGQAKVTSLRSKVTEVTRCMLRGGRGKAGRGRGGDVRLTSRRDADGQIGHIHNRLMSKPFATGLGMCRVGRPGDQSQGLEMSKSTPSLRVGR